MATKCTAAEVACGLGFLAVVLGLPLAFFGYPIIRCPQRHDACVVVHHPTGATWHLEGPPVGHRQNPTIGIPGQWVAGYYHFASTGSAQDDQFDDVMRCPGVVSVPKHESHVEFRE